MSNYDPDAQRLFISDILNCRDLGGMPLSSGGSTAYKVFIRCGAPMLLSDKAPYLLKGYGVRTVIDLRSSDELISTGNPFEHDDDVRFYNIPLSIGDPEAEDDPVMEYLHTKKLGDLYVMMFEELGQNIARVLRILINNDDGICLFHCAHGKDRTGIIAAIIYLIAGASRDDIITNYKISYDYSRSFLDPLIENKPEETKHALRSDAENMVILLDYLDRKYNGDINRYLLSLGMSSEETEKLRERITAPCRP